MSSSPYLALRGWFVGIGISPTMRLENNLVLTVWWRIPEEEEDFNSRKPVRERLGEEGEIEVTVTKLLDF